MGGTKGKVTFSEGLLIMIGGMESGMVSFDVSWSPDVIIGRLEDEGVSTSSVEVCEGNMSSVVLYSKLL
ncbi:unnamed protein product [Rhizophagus irregularis]|nr:unnamed protein product [Rhizophagus irregularis]